VQEAKEKGIGAVVVTDEDWRRWEYGLPPFRRLFKKVTQKDSVMTFGIERYLGIVEDLDQKYEQVVVIDGIQTNPFYYWSGNFLKGTLELNNRNKDMLVIGLEDANDYRNIPTTANYRSRFDAYHGEQFTRPYQDLIDYVKERRGLIFWSHPEYEENRLMEGVRLITVPYQWDLVGTDGYTGFGIFWEGYKKTGRPLGVWDRVLTEYCQGKRDFPAWAIGELEDEGDKELDDVLNIIYVDSLDKQHVLDALRKGRCYVEFNLHKESLLELRDFSIQDNKGGNVAIMGEEISFSGNPLVKIHLLQNHPMNQNISVKLIRNNKVIKEFKGISELKIEYEDKELVGGQKYYYRIDVISGSHIVSNPIFFEKFL